MENSFDYATKEYTSLKPKSYKLKFLTKVASPIFTGKVIKGEASCGNESIKVILVDSQTDEPITNEPAAFKRVRIVLLPEDFEGIWTHSQFKRSIITDWGNNKNILGDHFLHLKHGKGFVGKIWIKHNRNHFSKAKFRLGAIIDNCSYEIEEAITDTFEVKDQRNELKSKKARLLKLTDKVSQLKFIGKKGVERLEGENILSVKDFLDRLSSNPLVLQKICGSNGKRWEETVRHAKTSISDKKCNICGSIGFTSQGLDNTPLVDHAECTEVEVDSYEPSPSYDNAMTFDDFHLQGHDQHLYSFYTMDELVFNAY
ncbi:CALMODULIN-BINDING PROTEIN60 [Artemisia annua]|uniref:CALMODULIN-BINDING PROTEIN60 n=1 Tax=Artemisia annua TaxID=35608 RepID=A0A2U1PU50_ARTAN|nr:CALMODULIN-BINDING PROTEIN60 [Artemisia annua]